MKSSNVLLGLWFLVVMGLAFAGVWFLVRKSDGQGDLYGKPAPVVSEPSTNAPPAEPGKRPPGPRKRPQPPAPPPPAIGGRVMDLDGKPVAGAGIRILPPTKAVPPPSEPDLDEVRRVSSIVDVDEEDWASLRPVAAWAEVPDPAAPESPDAQVPFAAGESGADGRFSIPIGPGLGRGPFRVVARSETLGSAGATGVMAGQNVDLVLASGGIVTGQVVSDAKSGPVAGARLAFDSGEKQFTAVTDESGNFRVEGMSPGRYGLRAGAKGYTPVLDRPVTVVRDQPLVVKLPRGVTLRVKAILDDGSAPAGAEPVVKDAEVVVMNEDNFAYVIGRTDSSGVATFDGLPAGHWLANGRAEGLVPGGEEVFILKEDQPLHECELAFEPAVPTPITVVDEEGQPVGGMEFFTANQDEQYDVLRSERLPGTTDVRGQYSCAFEFTGRRSMAFGFKKGFGVVRAYPDDYQSGEPLRLVAKKCVRVHGKVTSSKGEGLADAIVEFTVDPSSASDRQDDSMTLRVRTGPEGRYDFAYLPAGFVITVQAENEDGYSNDEPVIEADDAKTEHAIDLVIDEDPVPQMIPGRMGPK